jgi:hypothetical protein
MALEFDGSSQYIRVTQNSGLPIYNDTSYSVCGWVKAPAQDDKRIFAEGSTASNTPLFAIGSGGTTDGKDDKIHMYIRNDASAANLHAFSTTTVFDSTWHFFCWVDNNGDADLYIDGTLDATNFNYTRSGSFTLNRTGIAAIIRASISYYLDGELFDIRCYNRCLTANEVQEIYHNRGADRVWQGLVGRWRLDEAPSGTPAPLLLDSMDSTSGWTVFGGWGTVSVNTTTYLQGTGALNFTKTSKASGSRDFYMEKTISATNITNQTIKCNLYIKDSTTLAKISSAQLFLYCPNVANRISKHFSSLSVGWNELYAHVDDFAATGSPNLANVRLIRVDVDAVSDDTTWSVGDVIVDFYRTDDYPYSGSLQVSDLSGNGNHGTPHGGTYQASPHRLRRGVLVS